MLKYFHKILERLKPRRKVLVIGIYQEYDLFTFSRIYNLDTPERLFDLLCKDAEIIFHEILIINKKFEVTQFQPFEEEDD